MKMSCGGAALRSILSMRSGAPSPAPDLPSPTHCTPVPPPSPFPPCPMRAGACHRARTWLRVAADVALQRAWVAGMAPAAPGAPATAYVGRGAPRGVEGAKRGADAVRGRTFVVTGATRCAKGVCRPRLPAASPRGTHARPPAPSARAWHPFCMRCWRMRRDFACGADVARGGSLHCLRLH